jgi:hypothetical protein
MIVHEGGSYDLNVEASVVSSWQNSLINNGENAAGFGVGKCVVPQTVAMLCYGIALRTTGVMAVFNQADCNAQCFGAHFGTVAIHVVKQHPFLVIFRFGCYKYATVAECIEMPAFASISIPSI